MKEFSNKLNGADEYITVLDVIKTENLYNVRRRERLFCISLKDELGMMKDEVSASSFLIFNQINLKFVYLLHKLQKEFFTG